MERKLKSDLDAKGSEVPDSRPMSLPVGFQRPPTIQEMVRQAIRGEFSRVASEQGKESFDDADDFDTGEDNELSSPYELDDEQERSSLREFVEETPLPKPVAKPTPAKVKKTPSKGKAPAASAPEASPEPDLFPHDEE